MLQVKEFLGYLSVLYYLFHFLHHLRTCSCIPLTGCVEKADLLRALCKYYGISYESIADSTTMNRYDLLSLTRHLFCIV